MLLNTENISLRSSQVLYIFVLRAEKVTIFEPRNCREDGKFLPRKACFPLGAILRAERHFPLKLCSNKLGSSSTSEVA